MKAIKARLSKFSTVDEFINGWGSYYFGGGLLLPTRNTEPTGTAVSLHIQIATGDTVLRGEGTVEEVRTNSSGKPVGMVIRFTKLDAASKDLVRQILDHKRKARTSTSEVVVEDSAVSGLTDQAANANLGASEIGAIADELEQTFDSIFSESVLGVNNASPDETADMGVLSGQDDMEPTLEDSDASEHSDEADGARVNDPTADLESEGVLEDDEPDAADGGAPEEAAEEPLNEFEVPGTMEDPPVESDASSETESSEHADRASSDPETEAAGPAEPRPPQVAPHELQPENRVSNFIKEVTGGFVHEGSLLTHEEPEIESPRVTSLADATAKAKAAAAEGEAALDDMLASATMSAPVPGSTPSPKLPIRARPKSLIERVMAWFKALFG